MRVCEIYSAPQGEGATTGTPSLFVRLSGCNLHCGWCDTYFTWNFTNTKFKNEPFQFPKVNQADEMTEYSLDEFRDKVREEAIRANVKNIILTGGEPLVQQLGLYMSLNQLKLEGYTFEVETNGTIPMTEDIFNMLDRVNCSPKLANSGNDKVLRFRLEALRKVVSHKGSTFKFVIMSSEDADEIKNIVEQSEMPSERVYLMPEGVTRESQIEGFALAERLAIEHGYKVCPRVHILINGTKRAV